MPAAASGKGVRLDPSLDFKAVGTPTLVDVSKPHKAPAPKAAQAGKAAAEPAFKARR